MHCRACYKYVADDETITTMRSRDSWIDSPQRIHDNLFVDNRAVLWITDRLQPSLINPVIRKRGTTARGELIAMYLDVLHWVPEFVRDELESGRSATGWRIEGANEASQIREECSDGRWRCTAGRWVGRDEPGRPWCRDRPDLDAHRQSHDRMMMMVRTTQRCVPYKADIALVKEGLGGEPLPHESTGGRVVDGGDESVDVVVHCPRSSGMRAAGRLVLTAYPGIGGHLRTSPVAMP